MNSAFSLTEAGHLITSQPLHSLIDSLSTHPLVHWIETDESTVRLWRRWQHLWLAETGLGVSPDQTQLLIV